MTALDLTRPQSDRPGIFAAIAQVFDMLTTAQSRAQAFRELSGKSDRELEDMGLARGDIARRVYGDVITL